MAARDQILQNDIEQAILNSFIPQNGVNWSPKSSPNSVKFSTLLEQAIVKYHTTPAFIFNGPLPTGALNSGYTTGIIIPHNLGYFPKINPLETFDILSGQFVTTPATISPVVLSLINNSIIVVQGTVGQLVRITLW